MIFVTVGTQVHDFKRLFSYLEKLECEEEIIVQYGHSTYNLDYKSFSFDDNLHQYIKDASIVICHGGAGTMIEALKLNKKIIAVPRLKSYDEHVDNHQVELCNKLFLDNYLMVANDEQTFITSFNDIKNHVFNKYKLNNKHFNDELTKEIKNLIRMD
jgi:UDP-N-acetylglucosamine transferase subunit ALG13